jgi:MFS family permease
VIAAGLTICSAAVFALSQAGAANVVVVVILVYAAGVAMTTAATSAFITDVTRRARYGAAHGVFGTIYDVGDALGPIAGGVLVMSFGYRPMFMTMAAIAFAAAILFLITSRQRGPSLH